MKIIKKTLKTICTLSLGAIASSSLAAPAPWINIDDVPSINGLAAGLPIPYSLGCGDSNWCLANIKGIIRVTNRNGKSREILPDLLNETVVTGLGVPVYSQLGLTKDKYDFLLEALDGYTLSKCLPVYRPVITEPGSPPSPPRAPIVDDITVQYSVFGGVYSYADHVWRSAFKEETLLFNCSLL